MSRILALGLLLLASACTEKAIEAKDASAPAKDSTSAVAEVGGDSAEAEVSSSDASVDAPVDAQADSTDAAKKD